MRCPKCNMTTIETHSWGGKDDSTLGICMCDYYEYWKNKKVSDLIGCEEPKD